jgi:DNA repair ATPase RecN
MKRTFLIFGLLLLFIVFSQTHSFAARPTATESNAPSSTPSHTPNGQSRSCQAHQDNIKRSLTHVMDLATNIETAFDSIAGRVESFYTDKVLPRGKSLSNYNQLLADIVNAKTAVSAAVTTSQADISAFSCSSPDPKSQIMTIRNDIKSVKDALKNYRTAIRNLIVAVKSLGSEVESTGTITPSPTGAK